MFKESIWLSVLVAIGAIFNYGYRIVVQRMLGLEAYGQIGIIVAVLNVIGILFVSAIPPAVAKFRAEGRLVFRASLKFVYVGVALGLLMLLLAPLLVVYYSIPFPLVLVIALSAPVYTLVGAFRGILQGRSQTNLFGLSQILENLGKVVFAFALIYVGYGVLGAAGAILATGVMTAFVLWMLAREESKPSEFRPLLNYMAPISVAQGISAFVLNIDLLLLKLWAPLSIVGLYAIAGPVARIPIFAFSAIGTVLLPKIAGKKSEARLLTGKAIKVAIFGLVGLLVIMAFPEYIIRALFDLESVSAAEMAQTVLALRLLLLGSFFIGVFKIIASAIQGLGEAMRLVPVTIGVLALDIVLCLVLIPDYGMVGAASATLVAGIVASGISIFMLKELTQTFKKG